MVILWSDHASKYDWTVWSESNMIRLTWTAVVDKFHKNAIRYRTGFSGDALLEAWFQINDRRLTQEIGNVGHLEIIIFVAYYITFISITAML